MEVGAKLAAIGSTGLSSEERDQMRLDKTNAKTCPKEGANE